MRPGENQHGSFIRVAVNKKAGLLLSKRHNYIERTHQAMLLQTYAIMVLTAEKKINLCATQQVVENQESIFNRLPPRVRKSGNSYENSLMIFNTFYPVF
jgi:hypothetical protein